MDQSNQTTNLWELAENYVLASTTSTTFTSSFTTTTMATTKEMTTTKTTSTTTTSNTLTTKKDHSISSPNQKTKAGRIDSRGFPVKVVTDPHGLDFYFPDVLNLLFGFI